MDLGQKFDEVVQAAIKAARELGGMEGAAARGEIKEPAPVARERFHDQVLPAPVAPHGE